MIIANHVYRMVSEMLVLGERSLNVFYYKAVSVTGEWELVSVAGDFQNQWYVNSRAMVSNAVTYLGTTITDMSIAEGEEAEYPSSSVGTEIGAILPSYTALGYRLLRTNRSTRHGAKRLGGITEPVVFENGLAAAFVAVSNTLANWLGNPIVLDDPPRALVLEPTIVRLTNVVGEPRIVERSQPVLDAVFYGVTTQSSRKQDFSV